MEQNLNLYQIFYEVAGCQNFSIAAKKLYISQPAISKSISKLEENLNTKLFHRSSKGVTLTPEGELLYKHVAQALAALKSGEERLKASLSQNIIHLSIGVSATLCKYILLPHLKTFIAENPNIKITISCQSTFDTVSALQSGSLDIGLVGLPSKKDFAQNREISYLPLKTIEDIFVSTGSYISPFLNKYKGEVYQNEAFFQEAVFIMLDKENISRKHVDTFLSVHGLEFHNIIEVNNMDLSIEFARSGLGIACVISDFIINDLKNGTLCELKFGHKIPRRQIGFAYSAKDSMNRAMDTLIQYYQLKLRNC